MAFDPNVAAMVVVPVTANPVSVLVGRLDVVAGDPDVSVTVPTVIAVMPGPTWVLVWWGWDDFYGVRWGWSNADNNLGSGGKCGREHDPAYSGR